MVSSLRACWTRFECLLFDYVLCRFSAVFCVQFLHVDVPAYAACDCTFRFLSSVRIVLFWIADLSFVLNSLADMLNGL